MFRTKIQDRSEVCEMCGVQVHPRVLSEGLETEIASTKQLLNDLYGRWIHEPRRDDSLMAAAEEASH